MPEQLVGLQRRILELAHALREANVPVAVSDGLDAMRASTLVDLLDREELREALAATMVKSPSHRQSFDLLFDLYFPARVSAPLDEDEDGDGDGGDAEDGRDPAERQHQEARDIDPFLAELIQRILDGDESAIRRLAVEAVESFGAVRGRDGTVNFFAYRVFRNFNLGGLLRRAMMESGLEGEEPADALTRRLARDEFELRLRRFREEIEAEIRRRQVEQQGAEQVARKLSRPLPEDLDFFRITADEQESMRRQIRPLARKLATRVAVKRRRAREGRLDVRRTIRHSLSTGGVPAEPAFKSRKHHRPELVLVCDVSGSVAAFARFTLMLTHALQGQFSKVRSFAFIDTVDEVTRLFDGGDFTDAIKRLHSEAKVVWLDGHSDYGHSLEAFHAQYADAVTPKTTLLILGDARNNYRAANSWVLKDLKRRARRLYWLNPEPVQHWGTGDSIADEYARHTDGMIECRNLRQLAEFVERVV
jgi:uncharacterized protein with von Willebrand factor type A (vWA) domain